MIHESIEAILTGCYYIYRAMDMTWIVNTSMLTPGSYVLEWKMIRAENPPCRCGSVAPPHALSSDYSYIVITDVDPFDPVHHRLHVGSTSSTPLDNKNVQTHMCQFTGETPSA